jgi:hypothetical protein
MVVKLIQVSGICAACRHAQGCTYPRNPGQPTLRCEEFEEFVPEAEEPRDPPRDRQAMAPVDAAGPDTFMGLCRNCEKRLTCTYPKPAGGVWHCDEYC